MKTIQNFLISISVLLVFSQCTKDSDYREFDSTYENITSEYSVYSAILNQGFDKIQRPLVVEQTSNIVQNLSFSADSYPDRIEPEGIVKAIYEDLILQNDTVYVLENKFTIFPKQVQLITSSDLEAAFLVNGVDRGWEAFYKKYPDSGGYIRFSKVGYNNMKTEALVEYSHVYGGLGADGGFVYLKREGFNWILEKFILVWLS